MSRNITLAIAQCFTDMNMKILAADGRFGKLVQRNMPDLLGSSILDLIHEDDHAAYSRLVANLRESGEPFVIVNRYICANASIRWVRNHMSRTHDVLGDTVLLATLEALEPPLEGSHLLLDVARRILKRREVRCDRFGEDIFSEAASDILVDLFVNEQLNREVSVSSACLASHAPSTTALRHIAQLESKGLIMRVAHPLDRRRFLVELTERGRTKVTAMLEEIARAEAR